MSSYEAWVETRRPIFKRLPIVYQENQVTDWLTAYWDDYLIQSKENLDGMYRNLDPLVCDEKWLVYLAYLHGYFPDFWSNNWPIDLRRLLLFFAYRKIWPNKGRKDTLEFVFSLFGLLAGTPKVLTGKHFQLNINKIGDNLGSTVSGFYITQSDSYSRKSPEWLLTDLITDKLAPAWARHRQVYECFILGTSVVGDPLFNCNTTAASFTSLPPNFTAPPSNYFALTQPAAQGYNRSSAQRSAEANAWQTLGSKTEYEANCVDDFVRNIQAAGFYPAFTDILIQGVRLKGSTAFSDQTTFWRTPHPVQNKWDVGTYAETPSNLPDWLDVRAASLAIGSGPLTGHFSSFAVNNNVSVTNNGGTGWRRSSYNGGGAFFGWNDVLLGGNNNNAGIPIPTTLTTGLEIRKQVVICYNPDGAYYSTVTDAEANNKAWAIEARKLAAKLKGKQPVAVGIVGDSVAAGSLVMGAGCFVAQLDTDFQIPWVNCARPGNSIRPNNAAGQPGTMVQYLRGMQPLIQAGLIKRVVLQPGVNDIAFEGTIASEGGDANHAQTLSRTVDAMEALRVQLNTDGIINANIQIAGIEWRLGDGLRGDLEQAIATWASSKGLAYARNWEIMGSNVDATRQTWFNGVDNVHLTLAGHTFVKESYKGNNPILPPPFSVLSVSPNPWSKAAASLLTITGAQFVSGCSVQIDFGGYALANFINSTTITIQPNPGMSIGNFKNVSVKNPDNATAGANILNVVA